MATISTGSRKSSEPWGVVLVGLITLVLAALFGWVSATAGSTVGGWRAYLLIPIVLTFLSLLFFPISRVGAALVALGWMFSAFVSDSNIVDPITRTSGEIAPTLAKVAPSVLLFVGTMFLMISRKEPDRGRIPIPFIALMVYTGWMGFAALISPNGSFAVLRWFQGAIPAIAIYGLWRKKINARFLLASTLIAALAHVLLARFFPNEIEVQEVTRVSGYLHPTTLSIAAVLVLCWGVWLLVHKSLRMVIPGVFLTALGIWGTLSSRSRMGFVALFVAGFTVLVLSGKRERSEGLQGRRLTIAVASFGGVFVALSFWFQPIVQWFGREDAGQIRSLTGRTYLWHYIVESVAERPFFGWGPGALRAGGLAREFGRLVGFSGQAHNALMEALITSGVVGGILWLIFIGTLGKEILAKRSSNRPLYFGIFALLLVASISDAGSAWFGLVWYVLLSLLASVSQSVNPAKPPDTNLN